MLLTLTLPKTKSTDAVQVYYQRQRQRHSPLLINVGKICVEKMVTVRAVYVKFGKTKVWTGVILVNCLVDKIFFAFIYISRK